MGVACCTVTHQAGSGQGGARVRQVAAQRVLRLGSALALVLWTVLGPSGAAGAMGQTSNQPTTVTVQCSVAVTLGQTTLSFSTVAPGQTSQQAPLEVHWTDTCGTSFTATVAATDLVDYSTGASAPTSVTSGTTLPRAGTDTTFAAGGNAASGEAAALPPTGGTTSNAASEANAAGAATSTSFAVGGNAGAGCPEIDVTPGVDLSCPDTALSGTAGAYTAGEYAQSVSYTLSVPADAQSGTYNGWLQYTITG
jgi:hypothetical protein